MSKLYINPKNKKGHINPEIQGHFSEHLGRCIYKGKFDSVKIAKILALNCSTILLYNFRMRRYNRGQELTETVRDRQQKRY